MSPSRLTVWAHPAAACVEQHCADWYCAPPASPQPLWLSSPPAWRPAYRADSAPPSFKWQQYFSISKLRPSVSARAITVLLVPLLRIYSTLLTRWALGELFFVSIRKQVMNFKQMWSLNVFRSGSGGARLIVWSPPPHVIVNPNFYPVARPVPCMIASPPSLCEHGWMSHIVKCYVLLRLKRSKCHPFNI